MSKKNDGKDSLEEFINLLSGIDGEFADFYITETGARKLTALVGREKSKFFEVIGAHSSHSLICYWEYGKGGKIEDQPIVWLDSEGWPNSVIARNLKEFISLLPYDTGTIYDIVSSWVNFKEDPESMRAPREAHTEDDLKKLQSSAADRYEAHRNFCDLIESQMHIKICDDPVGLIEKAMESYPDLSKWLENLH